jgi:hypothetical protein
MSYDTTVNDALDPPDARVSPRRSAARGWRIAVVAAIALALAAALLCRWLLR